MYATLDREITRVESRDMWSLKNKSQVRLVVIFSLIDNDITSRFIITLKLTNIVQPRRNIKKKYFFKGDDTLFYHWRIDWVKFCKICVLSNFFLNSRCIL